MRALVILKYIRPNIKIYTKIKNDKQSVYIYISVPHREVVNHVSSIEPIDPWKYMR